MAKFTTDAASGLIKSDDIGLQKIDVPEIQFKEKNIGYDYHKDIETILGEAQAQEQTKTIDPVVTDLDFDASSLAIDAIGAGGSWHGLVTASEDEQLLSQAKKHIAQKEFEDALPILEEVLQIQASHHEATYLKAYCQVEVGNLESALYSLAPLRHARLAMIILARIKALREKIRKAILSQLSQEMMAHQLLAHLQQSGKAGRSRQFVNRLQKLIELDPEVGMLYFLLGVTLLEAGEIKRALDVVTTGIASSTTGEIDKLSSLQDHLEKLCLQDALKPAIQLFKQQRYTAARNKLSDIEAIYRKNKLVVLFDTYLQKLEALKGAAKYKAIPAPSGKAKDVEELYNMLVEDEVNQASQFLKNGQFDDAESLLRRARGFTPAFPFVNHMLANCIYMYNRLLYLFAKDILNKETLVEKLKEAKIFAQVGTNDLVDALDHFIKRLQEENKADRIIQEFVKIMDSVHGGIGDILQFNTVQKRMQDLKGDISYIKSAVSSADICSTMDQIADIVNKNLEQLEKIKDEIKDAEFINELSSEFKNIIDSANQGISSVSQIDSIQYRLNTLAGKINTTKSKVGSVDGKEALSRLKKNIDENLKQLDSVKADIKEQEIVGPLVSRFNSTMQSIQSSPISSIEEIYSYRNKFQDLKSDAENARRRVSQWKSKSTLDDLSTAIDNILSQLRA